MNHFPYLFIFQLHIQNPDKNQGPCELVPIPEILQYKTVVSEEGGCLRKTYQNEQNLTEKKGMC